MKTTGVIQTLFIGAVMSVLVLFPGWVFALSSFIAIGQGDVSKINEKTNIKPQVLTKIERDEFHNKSKDMISHITTEYIRAGCPKTGLTSGNGDVQCNRLLDTFDKIIKQMSASNMTENIVSINGGVFSGDTIYQEKLKDTKVK